MQTGIVNQLGLGIDSDVPIRFRFASSRFNSILEFFYYIQWI